jgi:hypothetical protein
MARYLVFNGVNKPVEHDTWPKMIPRGCTVREELGKRIVWYRSITFNHNVTLNLSDVPAEVKTLCLILNIQLY